MGSRAKPERRENQSEHHARSHDCYRFSVQQRGSSRLSLTIPHLAEAPPSPFQNIKQAAHEFCAWYTYFM